MTRRLLDLSADDVHIPAAGSAERPRKAMAAKKTKKPFDPIDDAGKAKKKPRTLRVRAELADGGSLHVRHMSDKAVQLDGVLVALADDASKPVWIQLAKPGAFKGHPAGAFEMTAETFAEVVRNFSDTQNRRIPIDFEHASEADSTAGSIPTLGAPAQGWIVDMKIDGGNLWGLVEWGDRAREYIKSGQYRYFSPAIRFAARDRVSGKAIGARMTSGALTNSPFLDGLKPLAAKDSGSSSVAMAHTPDEYMPAVRAALRLPELSPAADVREALLTLREHFVASGGDADGSHEGVELGPYMRPLRDLVGAKPGVTWAQVFDIVEDLIDVAMDKHVVEYHGGDVDEDSDADLSALDDDNDSGTAMRDPSTGDTTMAEQAVQMKELTDANSTLTLQLKDASAKVAALEGECKTLRDEKAARDAKDLEEEVSVAFSTYKDAKNLSDKDREHMLVVCKAAPEAFRALYPKVAPDQRHLLRNVVPMRASAGKETPGASVDIVAMADKLRKEDASLSREDSLIAAEKQIRAARH